MLISYCATFTLVFAILTSVPPTNGNQNQNAEAVMVCPIGYELVDNMCYVKNRCVEGYFLHTDGLCYLLKPKPCPFEATTTTHTATTTMTTATEAPIIIPDEQVRCPPGSIYFDEQCRKIVCTQGEYYEGRCLSAACPVGTVWRNKRCLPPGYITTILEIDNVVKNQFTYQSVTENINRVEYETAKPYDPNVDINNDATTSISVSKHPATTKSPSDALSKYAYPGETPPDGCCLVKSPRFCKPYSPTWICYNRSHKLCDPRICTHSVIYLKPPQIVQLTDPPMLVMPPNPPLTACLTPDCLESDVLDCSGCVKGQRETCSLGCYNYFCPGGYCQVKNSEDFCALYPGGFGCNKRYGCIWDWCKEKYH